MSFEIPADNLLFLAKKNYDSTFHALQAYGLLGRPGAIGGSHPHSKYYVRHHPVGGGIFDTLASFGKKIFSVLRPHLVSGAQSLLKSGTELAGQHLARLAAPPADTPTASGSGMRKIRYR